MNFSESELTPSSVGCLVDERPLLTPAIVRPYIIAIVLHRGAVREEEIYAALVPHCTQLDLNTGVLASLNGDWLDDETRLEEITAFVLGDMVAKIYYGIMNQKKSGLLMNPVLSNGLLMLAT